MSHESILYDYIFHYKANLWHAIKRGNGNWEKYMNGEKYEGYKMKNINHLIEYLTKEVAG
jgi:hypothetical protein